MNNTHKPRNRIQHLIQNYKEDPVNLDELMKLLKKSKGFQLGITILNSDGSLAHQLITKEFPRVDMLSSLAEVRKLILTDLEKTNLENN